MKDVALQEAGIKNDLYPFAVTRHVSDIRVGILTIREKWECILNQPVTLLNGKVGSPDNMLEIPGNAIPSNKISAAILDFTQESSLPLSSKVSRTIQYPWHISQFNDSELRQDFQMLTSGRNSARIPGNVQAINPENIFIEAGAVLSPCILNASSGPIYIGKDSVIMEAAAIRGPFALCEGGVVKMGAKIYGATTIGPYSVVGGEIKNSVIFGYSNKAHEGYLGDSVIGEWCNLGAGTSNSNLKNNLENIKVWNPINDRYTEVGMKCGMFMGDYSRSAINTSFNSGALIGICSNVFGEGLTPTFIPDFSWGYKPIVKYEWEKAIRDIRNWKQLKGKGLSEEEVMQLKLIFNQS